MGKTILTLLALLITILILFGGCTNSPMEKYKPDPAKLTYTFGTLRSGVRLAFGLCIADKGIKPPFEVHDDEDGVYFVFDPKLREITDACYTKVKD